MKGLGARVIEIEAPFDPEGGAYAGGGACVTRRIAIMIAARSWPRSSHDMTMTITITTTSIATTTIIMAIPMLMTTSKPPPIEDRGAMAESEAAALYRLMTWLSPSFPVGAFSYSSGIEWAVEAGDIADAGEPAALALRDAHGWIGVLRRRVSGACAPCRFVQRWRGAARHRGTGGSLCALARASSRNHVAGPRFHRHRALRLELRRARSE